MHVPMPLLAAAAVAFLLLAWLAFRRGGGRDLMAPPAVPKLVRPASPRTDRSFPKTGLPSLSPEAEAEIRELVRGRRKIEAIKRLRELSPMSLRDAKDWVERM